MEFSYNPVSTLSQLMNKASGPLGYFPGDSIKAEDLKEKDLIYIGVGKYPVRVIEINSEGHILCANDKNDIFEFMPGGQATIFKANPHIFQYGDEKFTLGGIKETSDLKVGDIIIKYVAPRLQIRKIIDRSPSGDLICVNSVGVRVPVINEGVFYSAIPLQEDMKSKDKPSSFLQDFVKKSLSDSFGPYQAIKKERLVAQSISVGDCVVAPSKFDTLMKVISLEENWVTLEGPDGVVWYLSLIEPLFRAKVLPNPLMYSQDGDHEVDDLSVGEAYYIHCGDSVSLEYFDGIKNPPSNAKIYRASPKRKYLLRHSEEAKSFDIGCFYSYHGDDGGQDILANDLVFQIIEGPLLTNPLRDSYKIRGINGIYEKVILKSFFEENIKDFNVCFFSRSFKIPVEEEYTYRTTDNVFFSIHLIEEGENLTSYLSSKEETLQKGRTVPCGVERKDLFIEVSHKDFELCKTFFDIFPDLYIQKRGTGYLKFEYLSFEELCKIEEQFNSHKRLTLNIV